MENFKKKLLEIGNKIAENDQEEYYDEDTKELFWYSILNELQYLILGWPVIALNDDGGGYDFEKIDVENNEIDIFETHAHIFAGGDWQSPAEFDIILNEDSETKEKYPFVACNIRCSNDFEGEIEEE